jgi:hypothetical protein
MHTASKRVAIFVTGLVLVLVLIAPPAAQTSETDRLTHFMVNQSFEVPGKVLQANTRYVIKLHDLYQNRNVVQVFTDDEKQLLAQFLAINAERREPVDETTFTFIETQPGYPKPIHEWFYPGRNIGLEFIYPKEQAAEIAKHMLEPAPTETAVTEEAAVIPPPAEEQTQIAQNEVPQELPRTEPEVEPVAPAETQPSVSEESTTITEEPVSTDTEGPVSTEPEELPRTAGELPLVGLLGMLCLGLGLTLKKASAKS